MRGGGNGASKRPNSPSFWMLARSSIFTRNPLGHLYPEHTLSTRQAVREVPDRTFPDCSQMIRVSPKPPNRRVLALVNRRTSKEWSLELAQDIIELSFLCFVWREAAFHLVRSMLLSW